MSFWSTLGQIGSVIASPLASVIGGLIGSSGQSSANESNLQAVRESNEQNYKIFQEQLGYNTEMWNKQNVYNTPLEQRQRYEAAGINPYFALGNIQSGQAQQVTAPSANPMQAAHFENAAAPLGSGIAVAGQQYVDSMMKKEQISGLNIENQMKAIDLKYHVQDKLLDLEQKRKNIESSSLSNREKRKQLSLLDTQIRSASLELKYLDDYLSQRNEGQREMNRKTKNEADEAYSRAAYQDAVLQFLPKMQQAELNKLVAEMQSAYGSAAAGYASAGYSKSLTKTEDNLRSSKKLAANIENLLRSGELQLQSLGLSDSQLSDARRKQLIERRDNSWAIKNLDGFAWWLTSGIGRVFGFGR